MAFVKLDIQGKKKDLFLRPKTQGGGAAMSEAVAVASAELLPTQGEKKGNIPRIVELFICRLCGQAHGTLQRAYPAKGYVNPQCVSRKGGWMQVILSLLVADGHKTDMAKQMIADAVETNQDTRGRVRMHGSKRGK